MLRQITACRICQNTDLAPVLSFGTLALTGVFPRSTAEAITTGPLDLVKCVEHGDGKTCGLVQLRQSYEPSEMYGDNYGYRSGLNESMVNHLRGVVATLGRRLELGPLDLVIDIGSNDSTLLQAYPPGPRLMGIDPTGEKFREHYRPGIELVPDFFSAEAVARAAGSQKAKAITSIAMLYDLEEPLDFFAQVHSVLHDEGLWVFEQSYMPTMLVVNAYDTICHEHLEYYALKQIRWMTERAGFKIVDVELSAVNGGSFRVTVAKRGSRHPEGPSRVVSLLREEEAQGLSSLGPYEAFRQRVFAHRDALLSLLGRLRHEGRRVLGYGASTKGNVILQFCGITPDILPSIAEVNADKFSRFTPGTLIPIVSEAEARASRPDFLLVLPWHFRENLVKRERAFLESGGRLIFPLPEIEVVGRSGVEAP